MLHFRRLIIALLSAFLTIFMLQPCFAASAQGKKALMIVAPTDFEQNEYSKTREALEDAGIVCSVASTREGTLKGHKGKQIDSDMLLENVNVADYDAIVFIGGNGIKKLWQNEQAHRIAQQAVAQDKVLGAICAAPGVLGYAGVLNGKKATAHPKSGARSIMQKHGCEFSSQSVVVDGKIITANGPKAATKYGEAIAEALN